MFGGKTKKGLRIFHKLTNIFFPSLVINCGLTCADVDDSSSVASILQKHQNTTIPPHIVCHYNTFIYPKYFNQYCNIFQICWFLTPAIRVFWADLWYFHTTYEFIPYANKPCCINTKHHHTISFVIIRLLLFFILSVVWIFQKTYLKYKQYQLITLCSIFFYESNL